MSETTPAAPDTTPDTPEPVHPETMRDEAIKALYAVLDKAEPVSGDGKMSGLRSALAHCIGVLKIAIGDHSNAQLF
jgi:hypothetical protein